MSDILRQVDEDLRKEKLTGLWNKFKIYIISIALLIIVSVSVYQFNQYKSLNDKRLIIEDYFAATNIEDINSRINTLEQLETSNKFSIDLINLKIADSYLLKGDTEKALDYLNRVFVDNAKSIIGDLALYKYLMIELDTISSDQLDIYIDSYVNKDSNFIHLFDELKAVRGLLGGNSVNSKIIFETLINDLNVTSDIKVRAEKYLDILN
tara:strand:+ start:849 stop:1475 length:627 start_codon:yes stop_codon:yes gene_type:complete